MTDGTLKVGTITNSAGSGNIAIGSGVTLLSNVPAFQAYVSSDQSVTDNVNTKIQFDTEDFDTDSYYDNSTYTFTPLVAGKYFVYSGGELRGSVADTLEYVNFDIRKNGNIFLRTTSNPKDNQQNTISIYGGLVIDMNGTTDFLDVRAQIAVSSGGGVIEGGTDRPSYFGAYRIGA